MEQSANAVPERAYYLKGNWRHIFWGLLLIIVILHIVPNILILAKLITNTTWVLSLIITIALGFIYLAYGLYNHVAIYRKLLIMRAAMQLLLVTRIMVSIHFAGTPLPSLFLANVVSLFPKAVSFVAKLFEIVFFLVIFIDSHSSRVLRIASSMALLYTLILFLGMVTGTNLLSYVIEGYGTEQYLVLGYVVTAFRSLLYLTSILLFFGAMSFSKK